MEGLYEWVRSLVFYLILMTMLLNLLPDKKYEKYLRLFTGMVFILLVFGPFANLTGLRERLAGSFEKLTFQNDVKLLQKELEDAQGDRLRRLLESYQKAVENDLARMAEGSCVECLFAEAILDMEPESERFGSLKEVRLQVKPEGEKEDLGTDEQKEKRILANREIVRLKKRIGEYYGLEEGKITIYLEGE
ncbi:MAG: stage III sporulation protein AF [Lachnospiraceae bacterium]|nr:stage III sporulation protein AF [Lachnospiraceae bacterium]